MMLISDAVKCIIEKYPDKVPVSCLDIGDAYVFRTIKKDSCGDSILDIPIGCYNECIDKKTGSIFFVNLMELDKEGIIIDITPYLNSINVLLYRQFNDLCHKKYETEEMEEAYLTHHGVKGQKWGVRNGPPYPIEKPTKTALKLDRGGYSSSGNDVVPQKADDYKSRSILYKNIQEANPDYAKNRGNRTYEYNCSHAVLSFVARQKGFNVKATPMSKKEADAGGITPLEFGKYFKGGFNDEDADVYTYRSRLIGGTPKKYEYFTAQRLKKTYNNAPDGAYGLMFVQSPVGGHFFVWHKEDDAIKFADPQSGQNTAITTGFDIVSKSCRYYGYAIGASIRLDNRELLQKKISEFSVGNYGKERYKMDNNLQHHGIKGMKWGVRRYQNKDGSYTKRGLERYRKAQENYDSAKEKVVANKAAGNRAGVKSAKGELKIAKRQLNKSYDQLAKDYKADQGKALYQKGKTITDNTKALAISEAVISAGSVVTNNILSKYSNKKVANISSSAIAIGGTIVNSILYMKARTENAKLRAYYAH